MSEVQKIKDLTPQFQFVVLINSNIIEQILTQIICVEIAKDWSKSLDFVDYFEKLRFSNKIDLAKIILKNNHPKILKNYSNFFAELENVKKWRNEIAHNPIAYERDSNEQNARLVFGHKEIIKQRRLTEKQMRSIMKKAEKCTLDVRNIWTLIGKTKGLSF
ncbi:MAG: hypothetical protein WD033_06135 [Nitrosopumilaceae archaeon]